MKRKYLLIMLVLLSIMVACSDQATPTPERTVAEPTESPAEVPTEAPTLAPVEEVPVEPTAPQITEAEPVAESISPLAGTYWQWEAFQDTAELNSFAVPDPSRYKLLFNTDGTVIAKSDCNSAYGEFTAEGDVNSGSLAFSFGPTTAVYCGDESLDDFYRGRLQEVASYVIEDDILYLNLMADAGNLVFSRGPLTITPAQIRLDTQGLPYSWQAVVVPEMAYDQSQPPGPKGMPAHIEILFGLTEPSQWDPSFPIMYITPVDAYRELWSEAGNDSIDLTIDQIQQLAFVLTSPGPTSGMPALPFEAGIVGTNDISVQIGRAVRYDQVNESSATQTGYRFAGRWVQTANPVTNEGMRYVYQGFTNDGRYLVSFFYPTTTSELPNDASQVAPEVQEQVSAGYQGYLDAEAERLNALPTSAWDPDLATLDALVGSLQIEGLPISGLQDETWLWTDGPSQPGSNELVQVEDPTLYQVRYGLDGIVNVVADCNLAQFPYELNQSGMSGGMLAQPGPMTLAQCGENSYSESFISSVTAAQDYRVLAGGNVLELVLPAGGGTLTLVNLDSYKANINTPEPEAGEPSATVISEVGANVRIGPGTDYPIIGVAPLGMTGRVVGKSEDGAWWAVYAPGVPNEQAWVSDSVVEVENVDNVPTLPAPPPLTAPAPVPLPTATSVPSADLNFTASRTTINAGETALLSWSVENVKAVYMYPVGGNVSNYPTTGQGSREVRPGITTTYVLQVINLDDTTSAETIEIAVVNGLTANRWVLQSYSSPQTGLRTLIPGTTITARFEANGNLSGSAGCNDYSGNFTAYDEVMRTSFFAATQLACTNPQGIMEQEAAFLYLMQQAARFSISAGQLSVFDSSGNRILVFFAG